MRALVAVGYVVAWDDDGPPRPQLPVRCLDDELHPPVVLAEHIAAHNKLRASHHNRLMAERARIRQTRLDKDAELRRRPGLTKDTRHE